ncbi:MAG: hypothetical protein LBT16_13920 [Treponema sp.]|jgi:hypothetical protein|nr:hypothetical protein [Treponema sp.]
MDSPGAGAVFSERDLGKGGEELVQRIRVLKGNKADPGAVLAMLKSYCHFETALCFVLSNGNYKSYAALDLDLGKNRIVIPREKIKLPKKGMNPVGPGRLLNLKGIGPRSVLWACPLGFSPALSCLLMVTSDPSSDFDPLLTGRLIGRVGEALIPQGALRESPVNEGTLRSELESYSRNRSGFQGIVLQNPNWISREKLPQYYRKLNGMLRSFARVLVLPSQCALILLPDTKDRELISHRLANTLRTSPLFTFESDRPERAFSLVQPYL